MQPSRAEGNTRHVRPDDALQVARFGIEDAKGRHENYMGVIPLCPVVDDVRSEVGTYGSYTFELLD